MKLKLRALASWSAAVLCRFGRGMEKRQRAGAVHDATATTDHSEWTLIETVICAVLGGLLWAAVLIGWP